MYFAIGWPQSFALPLDERIVCVKRSPSGAYFAVLSPTTVYIWSAAQVRFPSH